jgi:hypothetical protein
MSDCLSFLCQRLLQMFGDGCTWLQFRGGSKVCISGIQPLQGDFDLVLFPGDDFLRPESAGTYTAHPISSNSPVSIRDICKLGE